MATYGGYSLHPQYITPPYYEPLAVQSPDVLSPMWGPTPTPEAKPPPGAVPYQPPAGAISFPPQSLRPPEKEWDWGLQRDPSANLFACCAPESFLRSRWWCPSYIADYLVLVLIAIGVIIEISVWEPNVRNYQAPARLLSGALAFNDNQFIFPMNSDTFQVWVTALISIGAPCLYALLYHLWRRFGTAKDRSFHDLHHFGLGMATAVILAFFAWIPINRVCGNFRPDFYMRLQTGDANIISQGRESFPSGHTLTAFLGLGFFSHWWSGKTFTFHSTRGNLWKFFLTWGCPMALAIAQAVTRVVDNRHRTIDILGGALLGMGAALVAYHLNYPVMWAPDCHRPKNRRVCYPRHYMAGIPTEKSGV